jgi:hypothetical protein
LRTMCHQALALIVEANSTRERHPVLLKLRILFERMESLRSMASSYLGHMGCANSHRLIGSLFVQFPVLNAAFILQNGRIIPRYLVRKPHHGRHACSE